MPALQIINHRTGTLIYQGRFQTAGACLEQAAADNVSLDYADLRNANLAGTALDGISMRYALLDRVNLTGANLSEARLDGASFRGATLQGACLAFSTMEHCNFDGTFFGATDIAGAVLDDSHFSTLSAFSLNFIDCTSLHGCTYQEDGEERCHFSSPPLVLHGLSLPVVFMQDHLKIGAAVKHYEQWMKAMNDNHPHDDINGFLFTFFRQNLDLFQTIHRRYQDGLGNAKRLTDKQINA